MSLVIRVGMVLLVTLLPFSSGWAGDYEDTIKVFSDAGESGDFFGKSYGYAVFPTIAKAGIGIGGAYGSGRVYEQGKYVGDTSMTQATIGLQLGGQAYSQIIFFQDKLRDGSLGPKMVVTPDDRFVMGDHAGIGRLESANGPHP